MSFKRCDRPSRGANDGETSSVVQSFTHSSLLSSDRSYLFSNNKGIQKQEIDRFGALPFHLDSSLPVYCKHFATDQSRDEDCWSLVGPTTNITTYDSVDFLDKFWDWSCLLDFRLEVLGTFNETSRT